MLITLFDIETLILYRKFKNINIGDDKTKILELFGTPILVENQKKASPEIISYGALSFYMRNNILNSFSFDYTKLNYYENISAEKVFKNYIDKLLINNNISFIVEEEYVEDNFTITTENKIYLNFYLEELVSFGI